MDHFITVLQYQCGEFMITISTFTSHDFTGLIKATVTGCCLAVLLAACQQREEKVENAKDKVTSANQDLKEAKRESRTEWQEDWVNFKRENDSAIADIERRIIELRKEVTAVDMPYRDRYTVRIDKLENRKNELRDRVNSCTDEGDARWSDFKKDMKRDMDDLRASLKSITVKNS